MAQADWTALTGNAAPAAVSRGPTFGVVKPNGGANFAYGFNSLINSPSAVGLHANQVNFSPMSLGGSIRGAIKRAPSGGPTSFAPFFFFALQGTNVSDLGYIFGLSDDDPHNIVLRKGAVNEGLPNNAPGDPATLGTLLQSTESFEVDTWLHLRLDVNVQGTGDVILSCYQNDLEVNPVTAPVWSLIPGMEQFVDDALGVNSGSAPFTSGRAGKAFYSEAATRRGYFDHVEVIRQLTT